MHVLTPASAPGCAHPFSVDEYYRMAEAGILPADARVELLDGLIFDMMPIGPFHASVVKRLLRFFGQLGGERWIVDAQNPVRLTGYSEPQPDFVLLRPRADFYSAQHPVPEDVFLLVEVADSSLLFDRETKCAAYARAGIAEYWLLNLPEQLVEVYRKPSSAGYGAISQSREGDSLAPAAFPDAVVSVSDLVGRGGAA